MIIILSIILFLIFLKAIKKNKEKQEIVNSKVPENVIYEINCGAIPTAYYDLNYNFNEACCFVDNAKYFTYKEAAYYHSYTNSKHNGYSTTVPASYTVTKIHIGEIIITNQRVIFNSDSYCLNVYLDNIITCKSSERKITINAVNGVYNIYMANSNTVELLIKNIIRFNKWKSQQ